MLSNVCHGSQFSHLYCFCIIFLQLDVLVNNAGRSQRAEWMNIDIRVDKDLFDGNVFGLLNLSRIVMPHFLSKKKGQIAVTSSVCGKVGAPCSASYNATKHALHVRPHNCMLKGSIYLRTVQNLYRGILRRYVQSYQPKACQSPCFVPVQFSLIS